MERFMKRVDTTGGPDACHPRSGANARGYSHFTAKGWGGQIATRWIMEQHLGRALMRNEHVLHTCDNPACVNVRHLYLGTPARNMRDAIEHGRYRNPAAADRAARTHCPQGHAYTPENTYVDKQGSRTCRSCRAATERRRRRARKGVVTHGSCHVG